MGSIDPEPSCNEGKSMKNIVVAVSLIVHCATGAAEETDLGRQVDESMPAGFNRPLILSKPGMSVSHVWIQLRPGASCAVSLVETAGKTAETKVERSEEESVFARLVRDARSAYQTIHDDEASSEVSDVRRLESSWTGLKARKDSSETWRMIPRRTGVAVLSLSCTGTDSKERLESLRTTLRVDELGE